MNLCDLHGNTPLLIASKIYKSDIQIEIDILKLLLKNGASALKKDYQSNYSINYFCKNVKKKNFNKKFIPFQKCYKAASLSFDYMEYQKRLILKSEFEKFDSLLSKLPNFKFSINLDIKSSIIPFSGLFTPSGT